MSRGRQNFKETDATKFIRAAQKANVVVERIEVGRDGRISIFPRQNPEPVSAEVVR